MTVSSDNTERNLTFTMKTTLFPLTTLLACVCVCVCVDVCGVSGAFFFPLRHFLNRLLFIASRRTWPTHQNWVNSVPFISLRTSYFLFVSPKTYRKIM